MAVNQVFMLQGDSMLNTPLLLTDMINDGVRLLIYAGNAGEYDVQLHGAYVTGYLFRHMAPYDQPEAALVDHGHCLAVTGPLPTDHILPHHSYVSSQIAPFACQLVGQCGATNKELRYDSNKLEAVSTTLLGTRLKSG
ncbi:uncharacterized protein F5891DRAFT_1191694 [Suillus fuscotomentosus]|uniref:Uncharacterized protein n=1 Tax=Suillus fuscotomentosus TaxID=1912939 RepID=A0AAD4E146_9AGAM|nr:uncharacterized protein F5891DRAFT_1191694 [Suillus fuscotomentosus]KAG1897771.1 hypothetical protein F5891DRAFT_1191694 [Suillus fuscotomentosus]